MDERSIVLRALRESLEREVGLNCHGSVFDDDNVEIIYQNVSDIIDPRLIPALENPVVRCLSREVGIIW